jgi:hypothetical protein
MRSIRELTIGFGLASMLATALSLSSSTPAYAACTYTYGDVMGRDSGSLNSVIGNRGYVYVNGIDSTEHGIVRALMVGTNKFTNFIEFGWSMGPDYDPPNRIWFIGWVINGAAAQYQNGGSVAKDQSDLYQMTDSNRDTIWTFKFNGSSVGNSVNHNFSDANAYTLDEVETDCDTGFGEFFTLERCLSNGCGSWYGWLNLKCIYDDNEVYHFDKDSNTHHHVVGGQSQSGCAGSTGDDP